MQIPEVEAFRSKHCDVTVLVVRKWYGVPAHVATFFTVAGATAS
jgi:hypothetical protein